MEQEMQGIAGEVGADSLMKISTRIQLIDEPMLTEDQIPIFSKLILTLDAIWRKYQVR